MRPKADESIALLVGRLPNCAVFVRLRISNRISPLCACANDVDFATTRSTFLRNWNRASGFVRGAFPYTPRPGLAYALALNHLAVAWPLDAARSASEPVVFGSLTRFG